MSSVFLQIVIDIRHLKALIVQSATMTLSSKFKSTFFSSLIRQYLETYYFMKTNYANIVYFLKYEYYSQMFVSSY